jgi:hypothetical protein
VNGVSTHQVVAPRPASVPLVVVGRDAIFTMLRSLGSTEGGRGCVKRAASEMNEPAVVPLGHRAVHPRCFGGESGN